jgi:hypothetical protein
MTILFCTICLIVGFFIGLFSRRKKKDPVEVNKYIRRGLYTKEFYIKGPDGADKGSIEVVFEVGELESTPKLSKIEVIKFTSNKSEYNNGSEYQKKNLISMVNESWISTDEIEWITSAADIRDKKLSELGIK